MHNLFWNVTRRKIAKLRQRFVFCRLNPNWIPAARNRFLSPTCPTLQDVAATSREVKSEAKAAHPLEQPLALLTNGIGGMARMCVDLGAVKSKYDCLLGANLHARLPVDRHIFAKRVRVWVTAEGFITPLNLANLASFEPGPPAVWYFVANAG